jgi:hypothetical protein
LSVYPVTGVISLLWLTLKPTNDIQTTEKAREIFYVPLSGSLLVLVLVRSGTYFNYVHTQRARKVVSAVSRMRNANSYGCELEKRRARTRRRNMKATRVGDARCDMTAFLP